MLLNKLRCGFSVLLLWVAALLLCLPLLALFYQALTADSPIFEHLQRTVLWDYVRNSVILVVGVVLLSLLWGVPSAWLIARYRFCGRGFFRWALLLPLAMPAYLAAFVYTELLDYAGMVQSTLRRVFGFKNAQDYWFFEIRSMGGAVFVLSLCFAPYVYWLCVQAFAKLPANQIHAAELLGAKRFEIFRRVLLPLLRPTLAVACGLVAMETLADFGTVAYFSVWHLTTGIYDVWLAHRDLSAAAKLSSLMLLAVALLLAWEQYYRRRNHLARNHAPLEAKRFAGMAGEMAAVLWCGLVLLLGFGIPSAWLLWAAWRYVGDTDWAAFAHMGFYTLRLALTVAAIGTALAFVLQAWQRATARGKGLIRLAGLGYGVSGTVLAIGVLMITTAFDHKINAISKALGFGMVGLIWSGTIAALVYAFLCRFAAVSLGAVESGFAHIPPSLDQSAFLLGCSEKQTAWRLWLPLLRNSLVTAALLLFLESMKELSAAMLLRPFNVQTLSTYIYEYISAERFEMAALPALLMVVLGLPLVALLLKTMED